MAKKANMVCVDKNRIKKLYEGQGLTREKLADVVGCDSSTLNSNQLSKPYATAIAVALGVKLEDIEWKEPEEETIKAADLSVSEIQTLKLLAEDDYLSLMDILGNQVAKLRDSRDNSGASALQWAMKQVKSVFIDNHFVMPVLVSK